MLDKIPGSDIAMKIMLHLVHYGEIYPSAVAKDDELSLSGVQKQFQRFKEAGILVSKLVGKSRVYVFNKKSPTAKSFIDLVKVYYDGLSLRTKSNCLQHAEDHAVLESRCSRRDKRLAINLKSCSKKELWEYVAVHLKKRGIDRILVGGAVVSIYSKGAYHSGDLDFVRTSILAAGIEEAMKEIGLKKHGHQ